jgi:hypothetical protein
MAMSGVVGATLLFAAKLGLVAACPFEASAGAIVDFAPMVGEVELMLCAASFGVTEDLGAIVGLEAACECAAFDVVIASDPTWRSVNVM